MKLKKLKYCLTVFVCVLFFCDCAAQTPEGSKKLLRVLSKTALPPQCQSLITENSTDFLKELESLLATDTENLFILVDKNHYLTEDYAPKDLVALGNQRTYAINRKDLSLRIPVEQALEVMAQAAKKDGVTLLVSSTYRSYAYQKTVYERNVKMLGKAAADRESASAGTSQHQLGTVIDFGSITDEYAQTKAGKWLFANAERYGFSLSFPEGYEAVTGYRWECWHYRYITPAGTAFQNKWFNNIQQYMLEFIDAWRRFQ